MKKLRLFSQNFVAVFFENAHVLHDTLRFAKNTAPRSEKNYSFFAKEMLRLILKENTRSDGFAVSNETK